MTNIDDVKWRARAGAEVSTPEAVALVKAQGIEVGRAEGAAVTVDGTTTHHDDPAEAFAAFRAAADREEAEARARKASGG